jgi:hypothetical protein
MLADVAQLGAFDQIANLWALKREAAELDRAIKARLSQNINILRKDGCPWSEITARTGLDAPTLVALSQTRA